MNSKDISQRFPQFQFSIREAQEILKTPMGLLNSNPDGLNTHAAQHIAGRNLHFVLTKLMGIPVNVPLLKRNYYTVDGYWFAIKSESVAGEDERQPVYTSTSGASKSQQAVMFTLYVGKVISDPDFADWPARRVLVGRNVHLHNANYTRIRAELADLIDELDNAYDAVLPRYQAWKALQMTPAEQQDMFMQLIRRALREMPKAEVLPVAIPSADEADALAAIDGMATAKPVTLADVQAKADQIIALLDDIIPPDYDDADDDDDEDEDDDDSDPDDEDFDDELWDEDATEPDTEVSNRPLTAQEVKAMFDAMDYAEENSRA